MRSRVATRGKGPHSMRQTAQTEPPTARPTIVPNNLRPRSWSDQGSEDHIRRINGNNTGKESYLRVAQIDDRSGRRDCKILFASSRQSAPAERRKHACERPAARQSNPATVESKLIRRCFSMGSQIALNNVLGGVESFCRTRFNRHNAKCPRALSCASDECMNCGMALGSACCLAECCAQIPHRLRTRSRRVLYAVRPTRILLTPRF